MSLTEQINSSNIAHIRSQIHAKNGTEPYRATVADTLSTITDYDTFPYPRWWRGVAEYPYPIVAEREAGWRVRHDDCYKPNRIYVNESVPTLCFQSSCSTIYPCSN